LEAFDVVLLGGPVWNVGAPMIMHTLLEQWAMEGKTILPFVTYAVSGMGRVAEEYAALAPVATIGDGLAVRGEEARRRDSELSYFPVVRGRDPLGVRSRPRRRR
jgi:Flavodoxin